jgi:hypothetical protein
MDLAAVASILFVIGFVVAMYVHAPLGITIIGAAWELFKLNIIIASAGG